MDYWQKYKNKIVHTVVMWDTFFSFCLWQIWCTRFYNIFNNARNQVNYDKVVGRSVKFVALTHNKGDPHDINVDTIYVK